MDVKVGIGPLRPEQLVPPSEFPAPHSHVLVAALAPWEKPTGLPRRQMPLEPDASIPKPQPKGGKEFIS